MRVAVFRAGVDDYTLGGVSSNYDALLVVNVEGPFEPDAYTQAVKLESHVDGCLRLVPVEKDSSGGYVCKITPMFGGNYAATSDSRFSDACARLLGHQFYGAIAVHDRDMSKER